MTPISMVNVQAQLREPTDGVLRDTRLTVSEDAAGAAAGAASGAGPHTAPLSVPRVPEIPKHRAQRDLAFPR